MKMVQINRSMPLSPGHAAYSLVKYCFWNYWIGEDYHQGVLEPEIDKWAIGIGSDAHDRYQE